MMTKGLINDIKDILKEQNEHYNKYLFLKGLGKAFDKLEVKEYEN